MNEIKIRGNIGTQGNTVTVSIDSTSLAEQLPKVDENKLRPDDIVWVKCKVRDVQFSQGAIIAMAHHINDILLHIPAPQEKKYPCLVCGKLRTKDDDGTTFTVCEECWEKEHPLQPPQEKELPDNNNTVDGQSLRRDINSILDYLKKREG